MHVTGVAERMFESGMGHQDDLATYERHSRQAQGQLYDRGGGSASRRSPQRTGSGGGSRRR
jgi:hypothetical protein